MQDTIVVNLVEYTSSIKKVDMSKVHDDLYYKSEEGYIIGAYCYELEHQERIDYILKRMKDEHQRHIETTGHLQRELTNLRNK